MTIGPNCVIGQPFGGYEGQPTIIGDGATIRSGTCIYAGNRIGSGFQTGHKANIRELNEIGDIVGDSAGVIASPKAKRRRRAKEGS